MDPVADMLAAIKNGYMAKKPKIVVPSSKFKVEIAKVLASEKFIEKVEKKSNNLEIVLFYENKKPKLSQIKKVSKLGLRVYKKSREIPQIRGGRGIVVISTPKGVMTGKEAKSKNLGGEIICQLW